MNKLLLRAKRLLAGQELTEISNGAILLESGKIAAVGHFDAGRADGATEIDFHDATLMPGLIDAHMHTFGLDSTRLDGLFEARETGRALRAAGELSELLDAGFTSARCLGSSVGPDLATAIKNGFLPGPRLIAAGEFISTPQGTWGGKPRTLLPAGRACAIGSGPAELRQRVRERVAEGADFIKLGLSVGKPDDSNKAWGDDPYGQLMTMSDEEASAAVDEAHRHGLRVSAHAIGEDCVAQALRVGVDIIEHGYAISEQTRRRLTETQTPVVTTLSQIHFHIQAFEPFGYSQRDRNSYLAHWDAMTKSLQAGLDTGVKFVLGTDLIGRPTHPLAAAAKEFQLVVEAGMTPHAALRAGTVLGAELLGLFSETGSLSKGLSADIIAVPGSPLNDISTLQHPICVLKGGDIIKR